MDHVLNLREPLALTVRKGESLETLLIELRQKGLELEPAWIQLAALTGAYKDLKEGDYLLPVGITSRGLIDRLFDGRSRYQPLTVVEGATFRDFLEKVRHHPNLRHELDGKTPEDIMVLLGEPGVPPEGLFFPDTYFTSLLSSDLDILRKARRKMAKVLAKEWAQRDPALPIESDYQALILASIIEKETGQADERPAIAGVFVRRLMSGMRLQTDPSVIYGLGLGFDGDIRREDLRRDTPYNTYTRSGLPPTPIALPGLAAIHAALHPEAGSSLYFVAKGDGRHVFSSTLSEHEQAVDQYQRSRKKK